MKLVLATAKLIWAILSAAALAGCQPAEMVYVSLPEVSESASFPDLEIDAKPETPVEAPPQRSEGCGCGENCPCREAGGKCRCGDPPIPDKTLEAIEAYHEEASHSAGSLQHEGGDEPVLEAASNIPSRRVLYFFADYCVPCQQNKTVLGVLADQGVTVGYLGTDQIQTIDATTNKGWLERYRVTALPTYIIVENGREVSRMVGGARPVAGMWLHMLDAPPVQSPAPSSGVEANRTAAFVKIHADNQRGSGVLVERQGQRYWALTNAHVIRGDGGPQGFGRVLGNIRVEVNGKQFQAAYVKDDPRLTHDIALVTFLSALDFPTVSLADAAPQNGSPATSHGFPWSGGFVERPTVLYSVFPDGGRAEGFVSTATFLSGESGSAITDANGRLVGLVYGNRPDINGVGRGADWSMLREFLGPSPARDVASPGPVPPSRASLTSIAR